ncbi:MAG: hypothetical protein CM15mP117_19830 [Alphaproteobacteria bacterium]|nr:MAG: hypothetical protein CM15mP117_19830 [Alphaproteobacteria bacterium]
MPLTKIDHYAIRTNKLEETKAFYELLGLVDGERPNFPFAGYWLYLGDIALVHLISEDQGDINSYFGYSDEISGGYNSSDGSGSVDHLAFRATNADQLKTKLEEHNVSYTEREVPNMKLFQIFVQDPNKITIEINYYQ